MERSVIEDLIAELEECIAGLQSRSSNEDVITQLQAQIDRLRQRYIEE